MGEKLITCLIGYTGYVGSSLLRQTTFDFLYRSTNIQEIIGMHFNLVVCSAAPAKKWLANKQPENDWNSIQLLMDCLSKVNTDRFVLISTVDVFGNPLGVYEDSDLHEVELNPYGLHRLRLERFVMGLFPNCQIVRLSGLVGPGLRKNAIFDIHNNNNINCIDSRAKLQFYPMVNLWYDLQTCMNLGLNTVHLTSEPLSIEEIAFEGFGIDFKNYITNAPLPNYDVRSRYASLFGSYSPYYQYNKREVILAIRHYVQSEPKILSKR